MDSNISFLISFLAGFLSFLSPCVLPIVPGFISYIVGMTYADLQKSNKYQKLIILYSILSFVLGFSFVFILMGASINFISDFFFTYKLKLNFLSGIIISILGLYFIGLIKVKFLGFEKKIKVPEIKNRYFFPFLVGFAFAFGWSPCIGPILGSVLSIAMNNSIDGVFLLTFYSLGLSIPFIFIGFTISKMTYIIRKISKFTKYFQFFTGIVLIITGIMIFNGSLQSLGFKLNSILPPLEMLLI